MAILKKVWRIAPLVVGAALAATLSSLAFPAGAVELSLSQDWRFLRGDAPGAEQARFDDRAWKQVVVPYDFAIMDKADGSPPFDRNAVAGQDSGYLAGGAGWFRRQLNLSAADAGRTVQLHFEAVYMDAEIWLNGALVGKHLYGYTAFSVDLTGKLRAGANLLAVRVKHRDPSSRWYAGSGILRPVKLELLDPVHLVPGSVFVETGAADQQHASLNVRAAIRNGSAKAQKVELLSKIYAVGDERMVAEQRGAYTIARGAQLDATLALAVPQPKLWSPDAPHLYRLVQEVRIGGVLTDVRQTRFGIRTVSVDAQHGLRINGNKVVLRGGNIHHDNYMLGAAGFPDADARKVALMKAAGYNAIRNAHNPASQATLDAADELGMLVIDEAFDMWRKEKRGADYSHFYADNWERDVDSLVLSGRNHPSVLFWSIGNEIPEQGTPEGVRTAHELVARIRRLDPHRPVTQAINNDTPPIAAQFAELDVGGYNYMHFVFGRDHEKFPQRVMYTSESLPKDAFASWRPVETMPWVIGDFVWTAFDYLGESGIGWMGYSQDWQKLAPYPWHLAYCGEIDAIGRKRPAAYYREVLWKSGIDPVSAFVAQPAGTEDLPNRHLFPTVPPHYDWALDDVHPSWSWAGQEGKPLDVVVYSELPEVELFLNGRSLGRKATGLDSEYKVHYTVVYAPGRLTAVGYRDGKPAGQWELRTAGQPAAIKLSLDRRQLGANGLDLAYLNAELVDADGVPVYAGASDRKLKVSVRGAGVLAGAGNGNPQDAASLQSGERRTFHGQLVAAIRAGTSAGPVLVEVSGEGVPTQRLTLDVVAR
ncbi:MAG: glycoside hydrolase family 2 TIM barrel-domain containing protein [Massilia sp.]